MAEALGDGPSEEVAAEVEGDEAGGESQLRRNGAGEAVEGEVEGVKASDALKEGRDGAGEVVVAEVGHGEVLEFGEGGGDGAGEAGELADGEVAEESDVSDFRWDGGGISSAEYEGVDAVGEGVAPDAVPVFAAVRVRVPGGRGPRFLDDEEDFLFVWVASFFDGGGDDGG